MPLWWPKPASSPRSICPPTELPGTLPGHPARGRGRRDSDEKTALVNALRQSGGNQSQAAALLGVSRVTVWHRMKKHGIDVHKLITA